MFNSGILDVVIGVIVIFLQLSLVCTAVNELIALMLKKRAKELEKGIGKLLTNPQLVDKFYAHPLIKGLRPDERKPSYIPSRTFALALMDIVRRHSFDGTVTAATQAVTVKAEAQAAAQATLDAAQTAADQAGKVRKAADDAVTKAGAADLVTATKAAQEAANQEAAAKAQLTDAETQLAAAKKAKTDADANLTQVTTDAAAAKTAETNAQTAEAKAKENPKDVTLQTAATAARLKANTAADKLAPSASSLLTEARDKVAGVQIEVVPPELKTALLALMDNAGTNLNKAQANLEQWFDDAMDRVSGVYKRKSQVIVVVIAVLVTLLSNVDTLQVADSLTHDKAVRDSLVAAAPELARKAEPTAAATPAKSPEGQPGAGGAGTQGAGAAGGGAGAKETAAPTPTPEPSIASIKASLDELNKLGLPIGYVRVCTPIEETVVDSCVTNATALALERDTKAKLESAEANLKETDKSLAAAQTALDNAKKNQPKTSTDNTKATEENKTATEGALIEAAKAQADLVKAETDLKKAQSDRDSSATELTKAQDAYNEAKAKVAEFALLEPDLKTATKAAAASPKDEKLQQAAREARRKLEFADKCPKCRKASALTEGQLRQRMPTTHDYQLLSKDFFPAIGALIGDSWNLLYAHWLGWLITALAISLGAPFWFDTLNRVMVIRSTVKPHEKSREQESKDNPDEPDEKKKKT
ncbi:MAG TPA: hypothetical protein VMZ30_19735 [Pyrinomonadaceae bacterium]|nr:hypothetical protein [Pyrinomonadaceae bacterium]